MNIRDLIDERRDRILNLARQHGAKGIRLFGSAIRSDGDENSDVDFLVEYEEGRSLLDHVALKQDLEELLGRKVDLVTAEALHWCIRNDILDEAVPL